MLSLVAVGVIDTDWIRFVEFEVRSIQIAHKLCIDVRNFPLIIFSPYLFCSALAVSKE